MTIYNWQEILGPLNEGAAAQAILDAIAADCAERKRTAPPGYNSGLLDDTHAVNILSEALRAWAIVNKVEWRKQG